MTSAAEWGGRHAQAPVDAHGDAAQEFAHLPDAVAAALRQRPPSVRWGHTRPVLCALGSPSRWRWAPLLCALTFITQTCPARLWPPPPLSCPTRRRVYRWRCVRISQTTLFWSLAFAVVVLCVAPHPSPPLGAPPRGRGCKGQTVGDLCLDMHTQGTAHLREAEERAQHAPGQLTPPLLVSTTAGPCPHWWPPGYAATLVASAAAAEDTGPGAPHWCVTPPHPVMAPWSLPLAHIPVLHRRATQPYTPAKLNTAAITRSCTPVRCPSLLQADTPLSSSPLSSSRLSRWATPSCRSASW